MSDELPVLEHLGHLAELDHLPGYLAQEAGAVGPASPHYACAFCGVGDSGSVVTRETTSAGAQSSRSAVRVHTPTTGCAKFKISLGQQRPVFPIHLAPSLRGAGGRRRSVSYEAGLDRLAELLLAHRPPRGRTLVYACGQIDYFAIFAFQEVFRLLGVRNLTGNAEHCLNSGAVHNEILTGQEGPYLTIEQSIEGPGRFFLLNGWNGLVTHPPVFYRLFKRSAGLDAYLVEVAVTESAMMLAARLGPERVLLIRPRGDVHLALAVAHELLARHPQAISRDFVERFAEPESFERFAALAGEPRFAARAVAPRIAAEPCYVERLQAGIEDIACKLADPLVVPINIPSVGLSQTSGVVAHCLWGGVLAMLGKYGLSAPGVPAGGTLRIPGQINAQSEIQGLSRNGFMGRVPMSPEGAVDAARRMGLPDDAYAPALEDQPRPALDYADPTPGVPELFLCFGTQFESNMIGRRRWLEKLACPSTTLAVVDPIPDPYTLAHAELILPSPPHAAVAKLYQNGEWRLALSVPRKARPRETRSDATIVYDVMARIVARLRAEPALRREHPDLARLLASGYLQQRFEGAGLPRIEGEVSRPVLWRRVGDYMAGGPGRLGPLYCRPVHEDGQPIEWAELLERGSLVYGGVGRTRFLLDGETPFRDRFCRPVRFRFFVPAVEDLGLPEGVLLTSGRSTLSDDKALLRFAASTFNSGKATTTVDMPRENPLFVSPGLAQRLGLRTGQRARVTALDGGALELPVVVSQRAKGDTVYISFHKCLAEIEEGRTSTT